MSFQHGHLWQCNYCHKEIFKHGYGLPHGWSHFFDGVGRERKHKCEKHENKETVGVFETKHPDGAPIVIKISNWESDKYWNDNQIRSSNQDDNALYWAILHHDKHGMFFRMPDIAKQRNECGPITPSGYLYGYKCESANLGLLVVASSSHMDNTKRATEMKKFKDKVKKMANK